MYKLKTEDRVFIKYVYVKYRWGGGGGGPISTQKYYNGAHMKNSVHDLTSRIRKQKKNGNN